jgi:hypothetical protein
MAWQVEFHDAFQPEFETFAEPVQDALLAYLHRLQEFGPALGRPAVDTIKGSRIANLKELRFDADGGVWRVLFAFDGRRVAAADWGRQSWRCTGPVLSPACGDGRSPMGEGEKVMGKSLDEVMASLPAARRRRIKARAAELIAEEMTLRELRKAMGKTQAQLARRLGKPQATISRMEAQSDMLMSTLGEMIEGLGGRVRVVAELPGRPPVYLSVLGDLGTATKQPRRVVAKRNAKDRSSAVATGPRTRRSRAAEVESTDGDDDPIQREVRSV